MLPKWRFHPDGSPDFSTMVDDVLHVFLGLVLLMLFGVLFLLSKNKYKTVLSTRASQLFSSRRELKFQQQRFLGSMQAEENVARILQEEGWRHVFLRRRVAISRLGHNREIDVIAVGNVVLVVEVKNWRGYVWSNGRNWFQAPNYAAFVEREKRKEAMRAKGGGGGGGSGKSDRVAAPNTIEFEDVQEDNILKAAALRRYIENTRRIPLPDFHLGTASAAAVLGSPEATDKVSQELDDGASPGPSSPTNVSRAPKITRYSDASLHRNCGQCVVPVVVFTHPTVRLDPVTLKREKYVFTMETFRTFAREALRGNISADAPNASVQSNNRLLSFLAYQARRVLRPVPIIRGLLTTKSTGYLLDEDLQEEVAYAVDIIRTWDVVYLHDGRMITGDVSRVDCPSAHCMYERKHLLDINVHWNSTSMVGMAKTLLTNEAGHVELILITAKRLAIKKKENKPRNAQGNIRFKMQAKKHGNPNLDDRLLIKPAGSATGLQTYAFLDIKEVQLSHHLYEAEKNL